MTVTDALSEIQLAGTVERHGDDLVVRVPRAAKAGLELALEALRTGKAEALALLSQWEPTTAAWAHADRVLADAGTRLMTPADGSHAIGVWSDLDSAELRQAIRTVGWDGSLVRYLDEPGTPLQYKVRKVEGEPAPLAVLAEMEQHPVEPWKARDRMLNAMGWCSKESDGQSGRR
jgi:hypothetical protein